MKISDIANTIEQAVPLCLQEDYDNSGLIVGSADRQIEAALITVDITDAALDEALRLGAGMIISHHPIIFHPLKRLTGGDNVQRIVERAIKSDIALYACHTNLDAVRGGMSFKVAQMLGIQEVSVLSPTGDCAGSGIQNGFGIIGKLEGPVDAVSFLQHVKKQLSIDVIRHSPLCRDTVSSVALCTGAGASLIDTAAAAGADIYLAADFRYNNFMDADSRLIIADIGHFESEYCAIDLLYDIIRKKMPNFALHKSVESRNPVNYLK